MPISELLTRSCTVIHRTASGTKDKYGNEKPAETEQATVCEVQQQQRAENPGGGEVSDTHWLGVFPPETELRTGDGVRVPGIGLLELVGDAWPVRDPEGEVMSHVEATLRMVEGGYDEEGS